MTAATSGQQDPQAVYQRVQAVQQAHMEELMSKANVVGVGVGLRKVSGAYTDQVALVVMVRRKLPRHQLAPGEFIPNEIDGVPVDIQEVGEITAQT